MIDDLYAQGAGQGQQSLLGMLIPFILVFAIFYLIVILPARKKQKQHQKMVESLKPGDKIITAGGIYGVVTGAKEDRIEIKIAPNVKIEVTKGSVAAIVGKED
ncbi:MAG: preprotein translocase subunit YajC [Candidatus Aminicenantia bacterium]